MGAIELRTTRLLARIDPGMGGAITRLAVRAPHDRFVDVLRPTPEPLTWFNDAACYVLAPWSNRIAAGKFQFGGRNVRVPPNWPDGTAIHGDVRHRAWQVRGRSPVSVLLEIEREAGEWPWRYGARLHYTLSEESLTTDLTVSNKDTTPMPAGVGFHPFFVRRLGGQGPEAVIKAPNSGRYPAAGMIPTGPAREDELSRSLASGMTIGATEIDDVFAGFSGHASVRWPGLEAHLRCSPEFGHAVIYGTARDLSFFCLEPVSMVNDGFNLMARGQPGTGVRVLAPGESLIVRWALDLHETR
jgi:aldose 1-epimerase